MIKKILIANRGEIAVRIIRACKELEIKTVAVYSEEDEEALHVKLADEAVCIGKGPLSKSYLNEKNILEAVNVTGADSIHPGYGFFSENAEFAKMCKECNINFIGPSYEVIELMGNKQNSKELMKNAGVPVIPGSDGLINSVEEAKKIANKIGFPIMLKASGGGGGKGIRLVETEDKLEESFNLVKKEAKLSFNNDDIYMEKFIQNPRHVEIQILADKHGNCIYLGERDCSIQRNNQKVLEESPSTVLDSKLRAKMGEAAIKAVKASKYTSAGTVEFLVDKDKKFYFMEMNTRVQVEHPVSEMLTEVDIVKEQIKIASGEKLDYKQSDIHFTGHCIECRINAENANKNFRPSPGTIEKLILPGGNGVRVDSAIYEGYTIPAIYDSMIAKIIVKGKNREEAIAKMKRALKECIILGIDTNIDFLISILDDKEFKNGNFDTSFIKERSNIWS